jgi:hypothetical protein
MLASYNSAGGNVFLCGIQPTEAMRYFRTKAGAAGLAQDYPVDYGDTLVRPDLAPHWAATHFGVARVEETVGFGAPAPDRISVATSCVTGGSNPYPDLVAASGAFPYYDGGVTPRTGGGAEVIYKKDGSGLSVGVRRLTFPGVGGNTVFVALHPQFVDPAAFGALVQAVLRDFGETRSL